MPALQWAHVLGAPRSPLYVPTVRLERGVHTGAVTCCSALGPRWLASASADGTVCLWDVSEGTPRACGRAQHPSPVLYVRLLSPGTAVSACAGAAYVWRLEVGGGGDAATAAAAAECASTSAAAGSASTAAGRGAAERGCSTAFRLVRRIPLEAAGSGGGPRILCAAAWEMSLAAGCCE